MIAQVRRGGGLVALLLLLVLAGAPPVAAQDYTIGGRDILRVTVWGQADLSKDYAVGEDGVVQLPLIGAVQAAGLTTTQFAAKLRQLLEKDYLVDPQVLVAIAEYRSKAQAFFVLGEVKTPGTYSLDKAVTALEAITVAGGFTESAAAAGVKVIRRSPDGKEETFPLNLSGTLAEDRTFRIAYGDTVMVPRGNTFFVVGEVAKPGAYQLVKETNVLEAIAIAGGFTNKAAPGRTRVIRKTATGTEDIAVDMAGIMRRGNRDKAIRIVEHDVILVPESFF